MLWVVYVPNVTMQFCTLIVGRGEAVLVRRHHLLVVIISLVSLLTLGFAQGCATSALTSAASLTPAASDDFSSSIDLSSPNESASYQRPAAQPHRAQLGESCTQRSCVDGATCVGYGDEAVCSQECDSNETFCGDGSLCLSLGGGLGVCSSWGSGTEGESCSTATDCGLAQSCVSDRGAAATCVFVCDFIGDALSCPDDRSCRIVSGSMNYGICSGS